MKHNFIFSAVLFLSALTVPFFAIAQESKDEIQVNGKIVSLLHGGLRVQVVQHDGTALVPADKLLVYKNSPIQVQVTQEQNNTVTFELSSPFFENGELSVGFEIPGEKKFPQISVRNNEVELKLSKQTTVINWKGSAVELAVPKARKELDISLAEYGANDRWKDVTRIVQRQLSAGALNFQATNVLFGGDPAPNVVKSLVLTYSLDDDETIATFGENAWIRLQYNPKDYFIRLIPQKSSSVKFIVSEKE